jgi:hypothetical protein
MRKRKGLGQKHLNGSSKFEVVSHSQFAHNSAADLCAEVEIHLLKLKLLQLALFLLINSHTIRVGRADNNVLKEGKEVFQRLLWAAFKQVLEQVQDVFVYQKLAVHANDSKVEELLEITCHNFLVIILNPDKQGVTQLPTQLGCKPLTNFLSCSLFRLLNIIVGRLACLLCLLYQ